MRPLFFFIRLFGRNAFFWHCDHRFFDWGRVQSATFAVDFGARGDGFVFRSALAQNMVERLKIKSRFTHVGLAGGCRSSALV